uniref:RNA-directed DNA polymerase n=1 Tax=Cajanus cajan TaxID=3821 RepID=A0A151S7F2_CAJCA|nr:Retrovirus-related Pol polyprotein from transposon 297 family [Cajanus cajan]
MTVKMFQPQDLRKAFQLAKLYESASSSNIPTKTPPKFQHTQTSTKSILPTHKPIYKLTDSQTSLNPNQRQTSKKLTPAFMTERRSKGLRYFCDEPYSPTHALTHKKLEIHVLEVSDTEEDIVDQIDDTPEDGSTSLDPQISVNALTGIANFKTMRVTGYYKKKPLHILIDSRSTHNFLDEEVAKKLGYPITDIPTLSVAVANGARVSITATAKQFQWTIQNTGFTSDMLLIPLGCCDVVLGIEWLGTLGEITWNFNRLSMQFYVQGKKLVLKGATGEGLKTARKKQLQKTIASGVHLSMLQLCDKDNILLLHLLTTHADSQIIPESIDELLLQFDDIFQEPTKLPPKRKGHDHKIPLVTGANPINKRPYRYAKQQKDIIDKLVQDSLKSGIIQKSSSPFASPVVLVGKKDGSWRLCVDYRDLNKQTIKDRFPIPLVDDLLDELHGSMVFSKIDLRSGYNQVRMEDSDIHKTAFKTHGGHFEYLVMPFGLTNAPATFQGLMNDVFKEYLRRFLLVFFDDILIYSKDLQHHLLHLHMVLLTMRRNYLYAKKSKCYFGVERVKYLGHFITKDDVSTDPTKIMVVKNWPIPTTLKQLRGFLGLAGYYTRFVRGYGSIARPLTNMLKKNNFHWYEEARTAFQSLKDSLIQSPVLALPDFSKVFVVEVDASGYGIGAVLMQNHHPIAFISRVLNLQQQSLSTYEKELLAVVFGVHKRRAYLLNTHFIIRTDHRSLQYILSQRLTTAIQQKWLVKSMEFDFTIEFKQGRENLAADALSRQDAVDCQAITTLIPESNMLNKIIGSWQADPDIKKLIQDLQTDASSHKHHTWNQNEL